MRAVLVALLMILAAPSPVRAADPAREGRIASEVAGAVREGEIRRLAAADGDFLAIDTPSRRGETRGAVVLLHDRGAHADWPDVIRPLRVGLAAAGWRTLALQLPVAAADAPDDAYEALVAEAGPRIAAAVAYLRDGQPRRPIALVGHGLGARMGAAYLASAPAGSVQAVVAIGVAGDSPTTISPGQSPAPPVPTLDLYGARDLEAVRRTAPARLQAARQAADAAYQQAELAGADHAFTGMGDSLVARIRAWLHRVVPRDGGSP